MVGFNKIDSFKFVFISCKMEDSKSLPVWGRKYLIVSTNELYTEIFSGTCHGQYMEQPYYYFKNVLCIDQYNVTFNNKVEDNKLFSVNDKFYDIEIIKSVEDAKLKMKT
jgi:DNA-dependent RNA polymerase auxiliary subunit epsilon